MLGLEGAAGGNRVQGGQIGSLYSPAKLLLHSMLYQAVTHMCHC